MRFTMTFARSILAMALLAASAAPRAQSEFAAILSGGSMVPPVESDAFGRVTFDFNFSGGSARITQQISLFNLSNVFWAALVCGPAGQNGQHIMFLAGAPDSGLIDTYDVNGPWVSSSFKEDVFAPSSGCGTTLQELFDSMMNGNVHVIVNAFPNELGTLRGQVMQVAPLSLP